jgi:hypothetical protein
MEKDALPTTLGGNLDVTDFCEKMNTLEKYDSQPCTMAHASCMWFSAAIPLLTTLA